MDDFITNNLIEETGTPDNISRSYYTIALRGLIAFPLTSFHFDIGRDKSLHALNKAVEENKNIFLVAQKHAQMQNPGPKDIYRVGTVCKIKQVIRMNNDNVRIFVNGLERMEIESYISVTPSFETAVRPLPDTAVDETTMEACKRRARQYFDDYMKLDTKIPADQISGLNPESGDKFVYQLAGYVLRKEPEKQKLLEETSPEKRMEIICTALACEAEILRVEKKIQANVRKQIDKNQKEYYLREQLKAIHDELGDGEEEQTELYRKAKEAKLPAPVFEKFDKELKRYVKMSATSPEAAVIRTYLDWILDVPWHKATKDNTDLTHAAAVLDEDHYGLEKVKERILEFIAVHHLTDARKGPILCFVGPPGVGKTSIVRSIAKALERKFVSMSLGGVRDEAEIRGHRRTYIGSIPGRIISQIKNAGTVNPLFLFDEIDKMSSDYKGDPASAMLEVLDPEQNFNFRDHYLDLPYDLSRVMFITTANSAENIPAPLLDRMEVIELSGYTEEEKTEIALRYLVPKQFKANGMDPAILKIGADAVRSMIQGYTREAGVRNLEREIANLCRKIARRVVSDAGAPEESRAKEFIVTPENLHEFIGAAKFKKPEMEEYDEVGAATGLAWTSVGGSTLTIEVSITGGGKGEIQLTGNLGEVMKESARIALTLVRHRAAEYGIDLDFFRSADIHIHVPEGATPKDGPSAGVTMTLAVLSAFSGRAISRNVAMTGEVTLRGKVLKIGGLKEKALAAYRAGIKNIIVPLENETEVKELPANLLSAINFIYAGDIDDVFKAALLPDVVEKDVNAKAAEAPEARN